MLETVFVKMLESQPFTVAAFAVAISALWVALKRANASRVSALENGLKTCLKKHEKCESSNKTLILAVVDAAHGRTGDALARCHELLNTDLENDG